MEGFSEGGGSSLRVEAAMYQPSHTSPLNDVLLGFGISVPPGAIHTVRTIFVETTLTKPNLAWQALAKKPSKGKMESCLAYYMYVLCMLAHKS